LAVRRGESLYFDMVCCSCVAVVLQLCCSCVALMCCSCVVRIEERGVSVCVAVCCSWGWERGVFLLRHGVLQLRCSVLQFLCGERRLVRRAERGVSRLLYGLLQMRCSCVAVVLQLYVAVGVLFSRCLERCVSLF